MARPKPVITNAPQARLICREDLGQSEHPQRTPFVTEVDGSWAEMLKIPQVSDHEKQCLSGNVRDRRVLSCLQIQC